MNKLYKLWLEESFKIPQIINGIGATFHCPNCSSDEIDYQYVGDPKTKVGYLLIWCNTCLKGIHISRTTIPTEVNMMDFDVSDEELNKRVPAFEKVLP